MLLSITTSIKKISKKKKFFVLTFIDTAILILCYKLTLNLLVNGYSFNNIISSNVYIFLFIVPLIVFISSYISGSSNVSISSLHIDSIYKFLSHIVILCIFSLALLYFLNVEFNNYIILLLIISSLNFFLIIITRIFLHYIINKIDLLNKDVKNIALFGAGLAGQSLLRSQKNSNNNIVICIDDNLNLTNTSIDGVEIKNRKSFKAFFKKNKINEIWIGIAKLTVAEKNSILEFCKQFSKQIKIIPSYNKLLEQYNSKEILENLGLNSYLGRDFHTFTSNTHDYKEAYLEKNILITGAGGSIGSQLSKLLLNIRPKRLILLDSNELALYNLEQEIDNTHTTSITYLLGTASDKDYIDFIFKNYQIEIVIHAAAYKHVPLVENNVLQSMKNNIFSTRYIIESSIKYNIERLILISSDKAVRPRNIMGVTKRISELYLRLYHLDTITKASIVRFGNVLGSSGSVVPLFQKQILSGGPITITDPNMTRFFMSIEEACNLTLLAGKFAKNTETYVLDMGKEIKIIDLAKKMINLAGLKLKDNKNPNGDIEISFINKRPGEKLFEELLKDYKTKPTDHPKVFISDEEINDYNNLQACLQDIEVIIETNDQNSLDKFLIKYDNLIGYEKNH